jgi:diaminopimelate epimerase
VTALRRLAKYHGLGNDFLVVVDPAGDTPVSPVVAIALCERRTGFGADGVLHVDGGHRMTLHNADGSRAELSGNGIRCLAHALARAEGRTDATYGIVTDAGVREVEVHLRDDGRTASARVDMGVLEERVVRDPGFGAEASLGVDAGNPHLVVRFGDEKAVDNAADRLDSSDRNVELITLDGTDHLYMRVIERGVGETRACGTGATAAAWAARRWGLVGDRVTVSMPGGELVVELGDRAHLVGPSVYVGDLVLPADR